MATEEKKLEELTVNQPVIVQKRKGSKGLTIKGFNSNIKNLIDLKMVTKEEGEELKKIQKTIFERWVAIEMKM